MYSKINYTVVGIFVVLFTIGMLGFGFWLAKYGFEQQYDKYLLYFNEPVDGLNIDSLVKLNGVDVGKVQDITFEPNSSDTTRVEILLKTDTPITKDMYAELRSQGITGLSYIEILGGKSKGKRVVTSDKKPYVIPTKRSLMDKLYTQLPNMIDGLGNITKSIEMILSKENIDNLSNILKEGSNFSIKANMIANKIDNLIDETNSSFKMVMDSIQTLSDSFIDTSKAIAKASNEFYAIGNTTKQALPKLITNMQRAGKNIADLAEDIKKSYKRGDYNIKAMIKPLQIDIKELSYRYQELAEDIKNLSSNPKSILFGSTPPKGPGE